GAETVWFPRATQGLRRFRLEHPLYEATMPIDDQNAVAEYLVLGIWEAITLLGEASERCDAPDLSELLGKAEAILISVVSEVPALTRSTSLGIRDHGGELLGEGVARVEATEARLDQGQRGRRLRNLLRAFTASRR